MNTVHRGTQGAGVHGGTRGYTGVHRGTHGYTGVRFGKQGCSEAHRQNPLLTVLGGEHILEKRTSSRISIKYLKSIYTRALQAPEVRVFETASRGEQIGARRNRRRTIQLTHRRWSKLTDKTSRKCPSVGFTARVLTSQKSARLAVVHLARPTPHILLAAPRRWNCGHAYTLPILYAQHQ
jgi:hypothetical protein